MKSPSKYLSLELLKEIQNNYYRHPQSLKEYASNEVDDLIFEKQLRKDSEYVERIINEYNRGE